MKMNLVLGFLIYFLFLDLLLRFYFFIAKEYNIIDKPNPRSSHKELVVRGGGIIFPLGLLIWYFFSGFYYPWFFAGMIMISIISFMDDYATMKSGIRIVCHIISIFLIMIQLGFVDYPIWLWITVLFISTGIINAYNFMDGINGITAGYSLSIMISLFFVNRFLSPFVQEGLIIAAIIPVVIFSIYNYRTNARCFAGDVGSVSIAFYLVFLTGLLIIESQNPVYLMFFSLYGIETFWTVIQRAINKENIFKAHRKHYYQLLANEYGISHMKVSTGFAMTQLIINAMTIYGTQRAHVHLMLMVSAIFLVILSVVYLISKSLILKQLSRNKAS